jgi:hypothetical protein
MVTVRAESEVSHELSPDGASNWAPIKDEATPATPQRDWLRAMPIRP